jgi:hypothetical protein
MPNIFNKNTFATTYKDDFVDSANYHRILFNSGRALQARELTQMQTITQTEIGRLGKHLFNQGAAVNPGSVNINNAYEFVKLQNASLPSGTWVGTTLTSGTTSIVMEVLEAIDASGSDPVTLFVRYTSTTGGTAGTTPVRVGAGETLTGGPATVQVQVTDTVANPCTGVGTKVSIAAGDFFAIDRFVFAKAQSFILSKYTGNPDATIGFKVTEDIITTADTSALFDNQGVSPNTSSPGADRYRITLTIANKADLTSSDNFVYVAKIQNGAIATQVTGIEDYNKVNDILALRTQEESGNYIAKRFELAFETNDSDNTKLDYKISRGVAYVDGYRSIVDAPLSIPISKPRTTISSNNNVVSVDYGNYLEVTTNRGLPNISVFEKLNLRSATGHGGSTIGTARVRSITEDGSNYRIYLFDLQMTPGNNRQSTRSIGTSNTNYFDVILDNSQAAFRETANDVMLFPVPNDRPQAISDISLTVQRRENVTTNGSGQGTLTALSSPGETFADDDLWIGANPSSGNAFAPSIISGGNGGTAAQIGTSHNNATVNVAYFVNKAQASVRNKVLTETTETVTANADGHLELNFPDIYEVLRLTTVDSDGTSVMPRYTLDNGQRDTHYQRGKMQKKPGQTTPAGNIFVRYKYFAHQAGGDFFAVNSYTGQVDYNDIPTYTATNGIKYELRNVLDFRSSVNPGSTFPGDYSTGARINELPRDRDTTQFDVSYYQGKNARVVIDRFNNVSVLESEPDLNPQFPPVPANSMELYRVEMNPYTIHDSDLSKERIPAKRFTMADIGKLESRIDNLEETTALNLLEVSTETLAVLDASNNNRLKAGFFVDNFTDQSRSFVEDENYQAGIDLVEKVVRPWQAQNNINLKYDSDKSTNTILKGDTVYKTYSHVDYIVQDKATETENINPFAVVINEGLLELSPTSDSWVERRYLADKDNPQQTRVVPSTTQRPLLFNDFIFNWTGQAVNLRMGQVVGTRTFDQGRDRVTQTDRVIGDRSDRVLVRDHLIDQVFIPYMRSRKIYFRAFGLKPNTQVFAFFDNKPVANWVRAETFQRVANENTDFGTEHARATSHPSGSSTLTTNNEGYVAGSFFLPSTSTERFRTGTREFKLLDISLPNDENSTSIATTPFTSTGILETRQREYNNTRVVTIGGTENRRRRRRVDPLAQSFMVDEEEGVFITKIGVRFQTKDTVVPVACQIRPTVNGIPSSDDIVPNGTKVLSPSNVNVSTDATAITNFEFDEPVYLNGNTEYCIVLLADTTAYNVYVARAGDLVLGSTEARVAKQPSLGSMFLSQNARTWTPDQERDLTFTIQRAEFSAATSYAVLENREVPKFILDTDGLLTTNTSTTVEAQALGHGLRVGDLVMISGATATGGITANNINGNRTITAVDGYGFRFTAGAAATSTVFGGGDAVSIIPNYMFDAVYPIIETLVPPKTLTTHQAKFISGNSLAGTETTYGKDANWIPMTNNALTGFEFPKMVANSVNEVANLAAGVKSTTYRVKLDTLSTKVSPIVDTQRTSLTLTHNMVDDQASVVTTGKNVPLNYVAETDALGNGSMLSKHITIPVQLAEEAVGMKILIAANRPSGTDFDVLMRVHDGATDSVLTAQYSPLNKEEAVPTDDNPDVFREYSYLPGGQGGTDPAFTAFQLKIVFRSNNSCKVPVIRDLRAIAMAT